MKNFKELKESLTEKCWALINPNHKQSVLISDGHIAFLPKISPRDSMIMPNIEFSFSKQKQDTLDKLLEEANVPTTSYRFAADKLIAALTPMRGRVVELSIVRTSKGVHENETGDIAIISSKELAALVIGISLREDIETYKPWIDTPIEEEPNSDTI